MFALTLWLTFGPRAAAAEIFAELGIGLAIYGGGGGGKRMWRTLRELLELTLQGREPAPES